MKYLYCFKCGSKVEKIEVEHRERAYCKKCDIILYENPIPTVVALIRRGEKVLLIRRGIEPGKGGWALPGGFIEMNESPESAILREVYEETNLKGKEAKLFDIIHYNSVFYSSILIISYEVLISDFEPARPGDDAIEVRFFNFDDRPKLIFKPHEDLLRKWLKGEY